MGPVLGRLSGKTGVLNEEHKYTRSGMKAGKWEKITQVLNVTSSSFPPIAIFAGD